MRGDVKIAWIGGNCPVQAEGTIRGKPFYFRARGEAWSIGIGGEVVMEPEWFYEEDYGDEPYVAGWMTEAEARAFIEKSADLYRESQESAPASEADQP